MASPQLVAIEQQRPPCDEKERQRVALGAKVYTPWVHETTYVGYDYDVCLRRVM